MKNIIYLLLITLLFLLGCDQVTEMNAPQERIINKRLIALPEKVGLGVESQTYYKSINCSYYDQEFQKSWSYQTSTGGTVYQFSDLDFHEDAFSGTQNISMTFNTDGAAMEFGPSMQFQAPVEYTYKITGLDLTGVNPTTLEFVYLDANGNMYAVDYDYVTMDVNTGMLKVVNAILPHFSRYGFVN
jgi:hypothetical protein